MGHALLPASTLPGKQAGSSIALTYIYGIGDPRALKILEKAGIDPFCQDVAPSTRTRLNKIRQVIEAEGGIEGDLRAEVSLNIKRLIEIQSYRRSPSPPFASLSRRPAHPHQRSYRRK